MTVPAKLDILDLRHFNAGQLRPLLTQEAVLWQERLRWDYSGSTELLLQYLDIQILPGFVAILQGHIVGYCFCVYEGTKSVIGDIFVLPNTPNQHEITHTLTHHLIEVLDASPDIDRIEAQLLLHDIGSLSQPFSQRGFSIYPRLFLECELSRYGYPQPELPESLEVCPWLPGYYQSTAELIHGAYIGHIDSRINDQYRTLHGSLRFLHNIVRFPGCGVFDPEASWVLKERNSRALVGVILCSRVAAAIAHVTQICVARELRGHALGKLLLLHCMERLRLRQYGALTLTVSEDNLEAVRLYKGAGFRTRLRFEALVLDKALSPERARNHLPQNGSQPAKQTQPAIEPVGLFSFARSKPTANRS